AITIALPARKAAARPDEANWWDRRQKISSMGEYICTASSGKWRSIKEAAYITSKVSHFYGRWL
ncbi:MAG TPA: hypothetical protein PKV83_06500, partial [Methanothrix sp.]|nr:hypothetical protein [Methanothrix sp.]